MKKDITPKDIIFKEEVHENKENRLKPNIDSFGDHSRIVSGSGLERTEDVDGIHEENLETLKQMSEQEILEEKEKFSKMLDPKLLEFLKNRSKQKVSDLDDKPDKSKANAAHKDIEKVAQVDKDLKDYPNMTNVETDKMKWMGELPDVKPDHLSGFTARFGFDGHLLSPDTYIPVTAGLHHHGEDQQHPGYSVQEMMTLIRSSNNRQKQVGLELLESVLCVWWTGELDLCLDQNIVQELVSAGLVHLLRISLDSSEAGVVVAGVRCLVALLCCKEEERLLDWIVDIRQPALAPQDDIDTGDDEEEDVKDGEKKLTDHQLVVQDVVLGLMRMDILDRCHYLLSVEKYSDKVLITGILATMIRLARHSLNISVRMTRHRIMSWMILHHWSHPLCVKLVRVVCSWDQELAGEVLTSLDIGDKLTSQLATGVDNMYDTQLSLECHKLWCVLLVQGLDYGLQIWSQLYPVLVSRLMLLYNSDQVTSTSCVGGWLVTITGVLLDKGMASDLVLVLKNCVTKWLVQLERLEERPGPTFLQLVSVTCSTLAKYYSSHDNVDIQKLEQFRNSVLLKFLKSQFYVKCASDLKSSSCFLSEHKLSSRHPSCLPGVGVILFGGYPHPLLTLESNDILLSGVLSLVNVVSSLTNYSSNPLESTTDFVIE